MTAFALKRVSQALGVIALLLFAIAAYAQETVEAEPVITELRIVGPDVLNAGPNLIRIEAKYEGSGRWVEAKPGGYEVSIPIGFGRVVEDISLQPVNPVTVLADPGDAGVLDVRVASGAVTAERRFEVRRLLPTRTLALRIDPDAEGHTFTGMGGGVMFYDNQFEINEEIFDWCFKDVDTQIVHVLIRPDFEPVNDNDDWRDLNAEAFDWSACERLFWILWHAKQRNPDLKVYACLYSPPAWMKANDDTAGDAGLKAGQSYQLEVAEYVYAFLKHAQWKGTIIDYLCLFNEPDWPHDQDGTYYDSLQALGEAQVTISSAIDRLIRDDPEFDHTPRYVFPETLGPGSITRAGEQSKALAAMADGPAFDNLAAWGVHDYWNTSGDYWDNRYKELRAFPGVGDKPIWMTEWAQRHPRGDLASAMEYGLNILNALRLGASAWMVFEWCHPAVNQSGLISTQWGKGFPETRYWRSKSYYVFQQIANTSPAGGTVVPIRATLGAADEALGRSIEALAIRDGDELVVHLVNDSHAPLRYDLALPEGARVARGWVTGPTTDFAALASATATGSAGAYSVVTLRVVLE